MSKELINRIRTKKRNATDEEDEAADLIEAQTAQIETLREVLLLSKNGNNPAYQEMVKKVLSTTPNEALQAFAAKVREQAAQVIESQDVDPSFKHRMADAIRSLKEIPK